ncbi:MAG: hypothetical protein WC050_03825 [Candidatus Paceibacterota bacterium]
MRFEACDEPAAVLHGAAASVEQETGRKCRPDSTVFCALVDYVQQRYRPHAAFEALLDAALYSELIGDEPERTVYKRALGTFFYARWRYRISQARDRQKLFDATPFAPREQET